MPKDDDLKFDLTDLSDLFGGDVSEAREQAERSQTWSAPVPVDETSSVPSPVPPSVPDPAQEQAEAERALREREQQIERKYREMMEVRERELEARAMELEARIRQMQDSPVAAPLPVVPVELSAPTPPSFAGTPTGVTGEQYPSREKGAVLDLAQADRMRRVQRDHEFFMLYDEFRNLFVMELVPLVGEKKTHTMLTRTVEMARAKFPDILKNANWDGDGRLVENGSLDSRRMIENKNALTLEDPDNAFEIALGTLLGLRLQAVEKGLGTGMRNKVRFRLDLWISEKITKARKLGRDIDTLQRLRALIPA